MLPPAADSLGNTDNILGYNVKVRVDLESPKNCFDIK
jgi:hypothetical protein